MYKRPGRPQRLSRLLSQQPVLHAVGPAVEAAQVVETGVALVKELGSRQGGPAACAAVEQHRRVFIRQDAGQVRVLDVLQRQQHRPGGVLGPILVLRSHIHQGAPRHRI